MYENFINKAEFMWFHANKVPLSDLSRKHFCEEAIGFYENALKHKQSGRITKKLVRKNIEELKAKI